MMNIVLCSGFCYSIRKLVTLYTAVVESEKSDGLKRAGEKGAEQGLFISGRSLPMKFGYPLFNLKVKKRPSQAIF